MNYMPFKTKFCSVCLSYSPSLFKQNYEIRWRAADHSKLGHLNGTFEIWTEDINNYSNTLPGAFQLNQARILSLLFRLSEVIKHWEKDYHMRAFALYMSALF